MGEQKLYTMDQIQKKISNVVYTPADLLEKMEVEQLLGWHAVSPPPKQIELPHPHSVWLKEIVTALFDMYAVHDYENDTVNTCYECKDK